MKKTLLATPSVSVELATFAAGQRQGRHHDPKSRITFALIGGFGEDADAGSERLGPGDVLFKSRRTVHEDRFSEHGARLASLVFHDESYEEAEAALWRVCRRAYSLRHAWVALEAALAGDHEGLACAASDLLSAPVEHTRMRPAPAWLKRLKESLEATGLAGIKVAESAREAGVHPVHASRLFRKCYGASITEHAQRHSVRRALGALADAQTPLSEIALSAGFCDQSHMTRVFHRVTGRTPGAHRLLMAALG